MSVASHYIRFGGKGTNSKNKHDKRQIGQDFQQQAPNMLQVHATYIPVKVSMELTHDHHKDQLYFNEQSELTLFFNIIST